MISSMYKSTLSKSYELCKFLARGQCGRYQNICVGELVHDMLQIFVKCLFCDWQSEPMICDDVLDSSFFAFTPVKCTSLSI